MKKAARGILYSLLAVAGFLVLGAFLFLLRPQLILNPKIFGKAAAFAREQGWVDARWDSLQIDLKSVRILEKEISFRFRGLCVRDFSAAFDGCVPAAFIHLKGGWSEGGIRLTEVGPLTLEKVDLKLDLRTEVGPPLPPEDKPWEASATASYLPEFPAWLKKASIHDVSLSSEQVAVIFDDDAIRGKVNLGLEKLVATTRLTVRAEATLSGDKDSQFLLDFAGEGADLFGNANSPWSVKALARADRWRLGKTRTVTADANVQAQGRGSRVDARTKFMAALREKRGKPASISGDLAFVPAKNGDLFHRVRGWVKVQDFRLDPSQTVQGRVDWEGEQKGSGLDLRTRVTARLLKAREMPNLIQFNLHARVDDLSTLNQVQLRLNGKAQDPPIGVEDCGINLARNAEPKRGGKLELNCPVHVPTTKVKKRLTALALPAQFHFLAQSHLELSHYPPSPDSLLAGEVSVAMTPVTTSALRARTRIDARVRGVPSQFPEGWIIDENILVNLKIASFESWVKNFENTRWAIPAPFSVLKGQVEFKAEGASDQGKLNLPLKLTSRLDSNQQAFHLDGQGTLLAAPLTKNPSADLTFDLQLSRVQLELVRLNLGEPPRLTPDSRLKKTEPPKEAAQKPKIQFKYAVRVHTPPPVPVKIISNLAKAPVPIHVDLRVSDEKPIDGQIRVQSVPLGLFRRTASLERFNVDLKDPSSESKIDGVIKVAYVDYTVYVLLISTLGKPVVKLISDPPLPENMLLATLLFGRPIESLDADETESVGNTQAALADNAIGLASLYALASTPIQSVGYNPSTKIFTAKVRLAEGTSLDIGGTSAGIDEIGIRKRLSSKWSIRTDLQRARNLEQLEERNNVVSTFLEWVHRY